jgi:hypothetical protein
MLRVTEPGETCTEWTLAVVLCFCSRIGSRVWRAGYEVCFSIGPYGFHAVYCVQSSVLLKLGAEGNICMEMGGGDRRTDKYCHYLGVRDYRRIMDW